MASGLPLRSTLTLIGFWCLLTLAVVAVRLGLADSWPSPLSGALPWWPTLLATGLVATAWFQTGVSRWGSLLIAAAVLMSVLQVAWLLRCNLLFNDGPYGRPSLAYLSSVTERLARLRKSSSEPNSQQLANEQRALVEQLGASLSDWTAEVVVGGLSDSELDDADEISFRRGAMQTLAQDIDPLPERQQAVEQYLNREATVIASELRAKQKSRESMKAKEAELSKVFDDLSDAPERNESGQTIAQVAAELTQLESAGQALDRAIASMVARQSFRVEQEQRSDGLNANYRWLRLPVCLPGGACWSYSVAGWWSAWSVFLWCSLLIAWFWQPSEADDQRYKSQLLKSAWMIAVWASLGSYLLL